MSVQALCHEPHPVLRIESRPVRAFTEEIRRLCQDLIDTMYAHDGIGLAAPQIGQAVQAIVVNPSQICDREVVLLNPVLEAAEGRAGIVEGCLSLPRIWHRVSRAARVRVRGRDAAGRALTLEAEGLLAIVLQHEVDHLQGRLFIDRLPWFRRRLAHARLRAWAHHPSPAGCG